MSELKVDLEPAIAGRKRRYTPEQIGRCSRRRNGPGNRFRRPRGGMAFRRASCSVTSGDEDAGDEGLKSNQPVAPESEVKNLEARIRELELAIGRKTMDNEILSVASNWRRKNGARSGLVRRGRWQMKVSVP